MTTLVDPRLQSVTISVRSDDSDILADATGSNVRFRFNRNIQVPPGIRTLMTLTNAQIPNSWYALKTNTTLTFTLGGATLTVAVPAGTYSVSLWNKTVNASLKAQDATAPQFTTDRATLKQQVINPAAAWSLTAISANAKQVLRMYGMAAIPFGAAQAVTWSSDNVPDCSLHHNLYIGCGRITGSVDSNNSQRENLLCKIPVSSPYGSIILFQGNPNVNGILLDTRNISLLDLSILDHNGELVSLNGCRWNCSILLQFILGSQFPAPQRSLASTMRARPLVTKYRAELQEELLERKVKLALKKIDTAREIDTALAEYSQGPQ